MPFFNDRVTLNLAGDALEIAEGYEVRAGIVTQPAGFALRLGHGGIVSELISRYPEGTPFSVNVNNQVWQSGFIDGITSGESKGATEVTFEGRDVLAPLFDSYVAAERSFSGLTYHELVVDVFKQVGIEIQPTGSDRHPQLLSSNEANRRRMSGKVSVDVTPPSVTRSEVTIDGEVGVAFRDIVEGTTRSVYRTLKIQIGTKWYDWLKQQLDRAGFFLWATGSGDYVLSAPNAAQDPLYQLIRIRRGERGVGKVEQHQFRRNIRDRYTRFIVYGRGGGRNFGRVKHSGEFIDQEMSDLLGGPEKKVRTFHDHESKSIKQSEHIARRMAAESARDGWQLTYTVAGHSTEAKGGGRAVWIPDTVVEVDDRELGIAGNFYVETVTMNCQPHKTTTLRLMRPRDLVFSTEESEA